MTSSGSPQPRRREGIGGRQVLGGDLLNQDSVSQSIRPARRPVLLASVEKANEDGKVSRISVVRHKSIADANHPQDVHPNHSRYMLERLNKIKAEAETQMKAQAARSLNEKLAKAKGKGFAIALQPSAAPSISNCRPPQHSPPKPLAAVQKPTEATNVQDKKDDPVLEHQRRMKLWLKNKLYEARKNALDGSSAVCGNCTMALVKEQYRGVNCNDDKCGLRLTDQDLDDFEEHCEDWVPLEKSPKDLEEALGLDADMDWLFVSQGIKQEENGTKSRWGFFRRG